MSEYGLTSTGPNIKRLDTILDEMHADLSSRWGVNTQQNSESLINHLLTNIADELAELWEYGEAVYYSQYPSSAEGTSLDNAAQYGGSVRERAAKSIYPIHCKGKDGTSLDTSTMIASDTNPVTYLTLQEAGKIERASFNQVVIRFPADTVITSGTYTVTINSVDYSITTSSTTPNEILTAIKTKLDTDCKSGGVALFTTTVITDLNQLSMVAADTSKSYVLGLSENLDTETVTSILKFATEDYGDIYFPNNVIKVIVKADSGLLEINNLCEYTAGRLVESDTEFRTSYIDKIFNRSMTMTESVKSAILSNVDGVYNVNVYENDSDVRDSAGRYPHSIEVVADCSANEDVYQKIAEQIFRNKSAGINTYGDETSGGAYRIVKTVKGDNEEDITIRFSIPAKRYVWWKIDAEHDSSVSEVDYDGIRTVICDYVSELTNGDDVLPQKVYPVLYSKYSYLTYIQVRLYDSLYQTPTPTSAQYTKKYVPVAQRELATTTSSQIIFENID